MYQGENERVVYQSQFSRENANAAKFGAYYTDLDHVASCATFFKFPDEDEVSCFDNSAGDGKALLTVTADCKNRKLFVGDINATTAKALRESELYEAVVCADYLTNFEGSNAVFSFFWCNPPYGTDVAKQERYEKLFAEKLFTHLSKGAAGVFVLPDYVMADERFTRIFLARYTVHHLFKFRMPVYEQFKQAVAIVTKKEQNGFSKEDLESYKDRLANIEELPEVWEGEKIEVLPSLASKVFTFRSKTFDPREWLDDIVSATNSEDFIGNDLGPRRYRNTVMWNPPMPLSDSHLAMQATCGIGAGAVGNEKDKTYHLQRGSVRRKKEMRVSPSNDGKKMEAFEVDHAEIAIKIAEQVVGPDGKPMLKITDLM